MKKQLQQITALLPLTALTILTLLLAGCDPFVPPKGVWFCGELNITIDFDDRDYDYRHRGTIIIDGVTEDIKCRIDYGGYTEIYFRPESEVENDEIYKAEEEHSNHKHIYCGHFEYVKLFERMNLSDEEKIEDERVIYHKYTFVRVDYEAALAFRESQIPRYARFGLRLGLIKGAEKGCAVLIEAVLTENISEALTNPPN